MTFTWIWTIQFLLGGMLLSLRRTSIWITNMKSSVLLKIHIRPSSLLDKINQKDIRNRRSQGRYHGIPRISSLHELIELISVIWNLLSKHFFEILSNLCGGGLAIRKSRFIISTASDKPWVYPWVSLVCDYLP